MSCFRWALFSWMSRCFQRIKDFLSTLGWTGLVVARHYTFNITGISGDEDQHTCHRSTRDCPTWNNRPVVRVSSTRHKLEKVPLLIVRSRVALITRAKLREAHKRNPYPQV
jgi:hypothetical protein